MEDPILLSRWQFAITTIYHFLFVPITLGLSIFVAILETAYINTICDPMKTYLRGLVKFFGAIFLVNFSMGVVTGIVQEFHFGMNWSEYSRFMGDIFGAPLALEALTAFFLESTFIGIWVFGWDKLSPRLHCLTIWLVAFGSNLSAFWILVANSFMQHPVGYAVENGRAVMKSFTELISNPYVVGEYSHALFAGISTAGILVVAVCAWKILHTEHKEAFEKCLVAGAIYLAVGIFGAMGSGHLHTQYLATANPMKLSSMEALWQTKNPAPFAIVADINQNERRNNSEIEIPSLFSFMLYNKPEGEVRGIVDIEKDLVSIHGEGEYIPDVRGLFWSFRIMIACGGILLSAAGLIVLFYWRKIELTPVLKIVHWLLPLPFIANTCGWYIAEAGRQPWIVVGLQKTADAISPNVTSNQVMLTLVGFTLVYLVLAVASLYVVKRIINRTEIIASIPESIVGYSDDYQGEKILSDFEKNFQRERGGK